MSEFPKDLDFLAFDNFEEASRSVLDYLQNRLGFGLWMTTRTNLPHWIVLEARDRFYNVESGAVFKWADSFCARMVEGLGPNIVLDTSKNQVYASAEIGKQIPIGAYIGMPMRGDDGSLFGTLCAIDPNPQTLDIDSELPHIQLLARMLSTILGRELLLAERERELAQLRIDVNSDALTKLLNRNGWDLAVKREQARFDRYGSPIVLFMLDLNGLKKVNDTYGHRQGDEFIKSAADCLRSSVRGSDVVAKLGGDEFAIMAIECTPETADELFEKIRASFASKNIEVSIGKAVHEPGHSIIATLELADRMMYRSKENTRGLDNQTAGNA